MGRRAGVLLGGVVLVLGVAAIVIYHQVGAIESERVSDDVFVLFGQGSNVGVLRTQHGAVVVDTMSFQLQGRRIRKLAERLAEGPTQAIINTHHHWDHTHGNPSFAPGSRVVSTRRTLAYLEKLDADYWSGAAAKTLPNETFDELHEMRIGGKTIRLHHLGRGHTDGDLVALFVEDRVLHTGDLFFNGRYPNIDLEAGGSVREWGDTIDRVLELDFDRVIPGHGPVSDREGLVAFRDFMLQLAEVGSAARARGLDLEATKRGAALDLDAGFESMGVPFVFRLDRDFVIRRAWEEAHGEFTRVELP